MAYLNFRNYQPPTNLSDKEKVEYSIKIVEKHRTEAKLLRKLTNQAKTAQSRAEKEIVVWRERYQKSQEELKKTKEENSRLKKDKEKLEQEIDRLTKTNSRYQVALFDHGNFKSSKKDIDKKSKGGQLGHTDTNRESNINFQGYDSFPRKRIYAKSCGSCGNNLNRVTATKQKILLDIVIKPEIIQTIIDSERQWCSSCKTEVIVKDPQSLPFTEYGLNTFMMVMILRHKGHLSLGSISSVFSVAFGLVISKSDISNILESAAIYLGAKYEELKTAVRKGEVIYADETGWLVRGQSAWMWIMANDTTTVYIAAESRGKAVAEDLYGFANCYCMTDGLYSYLNTIPKNKHCYCWAHLLRFAFEETIHSTKDSAAIKLRDDLVRIYHIKSDHPQYTKSQLNQILDEELNNLVNLTSDEDSFKNIQNRLRTQRQGLILSLLETSDGTNNLAERELRPLVLGRKVSFGSDTYTGMETTAILGSIIQTFSRQNLDLLTELTLNLQIGIHQKYSQYQHLSYSDTS